MLNLFWIAVPKFDEQGACACFLPGNAQADRVIRSLTGRDPAQSTGDATKPTKLFLMRMAEDMHQRSFVRDPRYDELATLGRAVYAAADPFPHAVFDDFVPPELLDAVLAEFDASMSFATIRFDDPKSLKLATKGDEGLQPTLRAVLQEFGSPAFLGFLESLTGISGVIPDPYLEGAGLHQIPRGGFLKIHADFNRHPKLNVERRLNLLLYLNRNWQEEYGGHLELWDKTMTRCVHRILPVFNRCVIFNTTDDAFHGHPEPLTCPDGVSRKSIALYYYTCGCAAREAVPSHTTLFQVRPADKARMETLGYRLRAGAANLLESSASLAHKPAKLLRVIAEKIRPRY